MMLSLSELKGEVMLHGNSEIKEGNPEPTIEKIVEYDKTWLKNVLNGICPDCEGNLEKKGILRRCVTHNHLHIYGNPILVAYKREKKITYPPIRYDNCPECGSTVFFEDEDRNEITCKCGLVLAGPYQYGIKYPWHDKYIGVP